MNLVLFLLFLSEFSYVVLTRRVVFLWTIEGSPNRLTDEETHGMAHSSLVASETYLKNKLCKKE